MDIYMYDSYMCMTQMPGWMQMADEALLVHHPPAPVRALKQVGGGTLAAATGITTSGVTSG